MKTPQGRNYVKSIRTPVDGVAQFKGQRRELTSLEQFDKFAFSLN